MIDRVLSRLATPFGGYYELGRRTNTRGSTYDTVTRRLV
jgi:hypothetical protein